MRTPTLLALALLLVPAAVAGQPVQATLQQRVQTAGSEGATLVELLSGASAAGALRDFERARELNRRSIQGFQQARNALVNNLLLGELAGGGGVAGAQRAFRDVRRNLVMQPVEIASWIGTYPELLVGGEFDDMIASLSPTHPDPGYRCACYSQKSWMHRVAGRAEQARIYRDSAVTNAAEPQTATARAQRVRDLARAGRPEEARSRIDGYLALDRWDALTPGVRRYWAQAHAELGDVERTVEILEELLGEPSIVSVHSLEARAAWEGIRSHPSFQALLARHR